MKKMFCVLLALCMLAGCSAKAPEVSSSSSPSLHLAASPESSAGSAASEEGVAFTDDLGREVTVSSPQRVVTMIGSFADLWCLAGGKDNLVATAHDSWTSFDLGLSENVVDIGSSKDPNLELILSAEPDFVMASSNTGANLDLLDSFESAGVNVAYFQVGTVEEYLHVLQICTQITGKPENYETYGTSVMDQVEQARARADGSAPEALYLRITGDKCTVKNSEDNVLGEMLRDLGAVNIADSETGLLEELSMEAIVQEDPDYIFVVFQGGQTQEAEETLDRLLLSNPAWEGLSAVQNDHYHVMDETLFNLKPNARWGEAYRILADILYPEV